ncbi:hypothetical protein FGO68_gene14760 [Halteria grandinella]|uniref:Uncharacterized protein n=1 Tax=Halteria grandinella TaxID=5974 RepID=A0A8J8SX01_HALGN|nr:hypothetical protein FGO68_gene14760 [Halteria grandinella]
MLKEIMKQSICQSGPHYRVFRIRIQNSSFINHTNKWFNRKDSYEKRLSLCDIFREQYQNQFSINKIKQIHLYINRE